MRVITGPSRFRGRWCQAISPLPMNDQPTTRQNGASAVWYGTNERFAASHAAPALAASPATPSVASIALTVPS
jgi:hypothetical protein